MKNYGTGVCKHCKESFQKTVWNQIFCKNMHFAICSFCNVRFDWSGRMSYQGVNTEKNPACPKCRITEGAKRAGVSQRNWSLEQKEKVVALRKSTMIAKYGGPTTLESPILRDRKEASMTALYGAKHTKNSSASLKNSAAKRAKARGISLEKSLFISELLNDKVELESFLMDLNIQYKRKISYQEIIENLDPKMSSSELSHKFSKMVDLKSKYINVKDSWLELKVIDMLKSFGLQERSDYKRHHKLSNRLEIDILIQGTLGFEINDFATHSRYSNLEVSDMRYSKGSLKSGPTYHESKFNQAKNEGIKLYYIWEDEVKSDNLQNIISQILKDNHVLQ